MSQKPYPLSIYLGQMVPNVVVDKTRNMEHPGTSNNDDNYEKNM